jgi:hypothetical protein
MMGKGVSRTQIEGVLDTRMKGLEIAVSRLFFVLVRSTAFLLVISVRPKFTGSTI